MNAQTKITLLIALMTSLSMSLFLSGFFTFLALGPTPAWLAAWGKGFAVGCPMGFVLACAIGKPIRGVALKVAGTPHG